jgi:hypothetical protein
MGGRPLKEWWVAPVEVTADTKAMRDLLLAALEIAKRLPEKSVPQSGSARKTAPVKTAPKRARGSKTAQRAKKS